MRAMTTLIGTIAATAAVLTLPATAHAVEVRGSALRVDRAHHVVEVVREDAQVHAYRYGALPADVHAGIRLAFRAEGHDARAIHVVGRVPELGFHGVVRRVSAAGVLLRLADGRSFLARARAAGDDALRTGADDLLTLVLRDGGRVDDALVTAEAARPQDDDNDDDDELGGCRRAGEGTGLVRGLHDDRRVLEIERQGDRQRFLNGTGRPFAVHEGDRVRVAFECRAGRFVATDVTLLDRNDDDRGDDHRGHGHGGGDGSAEGRD